MFFFKNDLNSLKKAFSNISVLIPSKRTFFLPLVSFFVSYELLVVGFSLVDILKVKELLTTVVLFSIVE